MGLLNANKVTDQDVSRLAITYLMDTSLQVRPPIQMKCAICERLTGVS